MTDSKTQKAQGKSPRRPPGKRLSLAMQDYICGSAMEPGPNDGWRYTPQKLLEMLDAGVARGEIPDDAVPSLKTVQRLVKEARKSEPPDLWSLHEAPADEGARLLPILTILTDAAKEGPPVTRILRGLAERILRLLTLAPDLPPAGALILAQSYRYREATGAGTEALDLALMFGLWSDDAGEGREGIKRLREYIDGHEYAAKFFEPPDPDLDWTLLSEGDLIMTIRQWLFPPVEEVSSDTQS